MPISTTITTASNSLELNSRCIIGASNASRHSSDSVLDSPSRRRHPTADIAAGSVYMAPTTVNASTAACLGGGSRLSLASGRQSLASSAGAESYNSYRLLTRQTGAGWRELWRTRLLLRDVLHWALAQPRSSGPLSTAAPGSGLQVESGHMTASQPVSLTSDTSSLGPIKAADREAATGFSEPLSQAPSTSDRNHCSIGSLAIFQNYLSTYHIYTAFPPEISSDGRIC